MTEQSAGHELTVGVEKVAVELSGVDIPPQFVNPSTLVFNGVVDKDWVFAGGILTGITESTVGFTNGVQIEAWGDTIRIEHSLASDAETVTSIETAMRLVESFNIDSWLELSIECVGWIEASGQLNSQNPHLVSISDKLMRDDIVPAIGLTASHQYPERELRATLYGGHVDPEQMKQTWFGDVDHTLPDDQEDGDQDRLLSILSGWERDFDVIVSVVLDLHETLYGNGDSNESTAGS